MKKRRWVIRAIKDGKPGDLMHEGQQGTCVYDSMAEAQADIEELGTFSAKVLKNGVSYKLEVYRGEIEEDGVSNTKKKEPEQ